MTDLKSEKWLWIKGGLFVIVAMLSVFLLAVDFANMKQFVLLMLAIWASCRAYYFCFYVIEKYIDREYRFPGLLYLPQYMFRRWNGTQSLQPTVQLSSTQQQSLSWFVFWPCVFCCGNIFVPALVSSCFGNSNSLSNDYVLSFVISLLVGQFAFMSVFVAYARTPLKFRLPMAIGLTGLTTYLFMGGLNGEGAPEGSFAPCMIAIVLVCIGGGTLTALSYSKGKRFSIEPLETQEGDSDGTVDAAELRSRLSIRYLLGATTIAAILSACARFANFSFLSDNRIWKVLLMGMLLSSIICYATHLCLEVFLKRGRLSCQVGFLLPFFVCLLIFPFAAYYLAFWLGPENGIRSLSVELPLLVCFEIGYALMLAIMFLHARSQGYRYDKPR
jgi:hypothetical protein